MTLHDSHCHFFSAGFFEALGREKYGAGFDPEAHRVAVQLGWESPGDAQALADRWVAELDRHRVSRAALIASLPGDEDSVAIAVSAYPDRFVGFFFVNPVAPDGLDRARRAYEELGLRTACLFPAMHRYHMDDERVVKLFDLAASARGAVFVHCGFLSIEARTRLGLQTRLDVRFGDPLAVAATAAAFPSVPVILPHFGGGYFREALMAADACPSIHFDTSSSNGWIKYHPGLTLTEVFRQALVVAGPDRIIFGSDSSFFPRGWRQVVHGAQDAILHDLGVEDESAARIFGGNFARLFPA